MWFPRRFDRKWRHHDLYCSRFVVISISVYSQLFEVFWDRIHRNVRHLFYFSKSCDHWAWRLDLKSFVTSRDDIIVRRLTSVLSFICSSGPLDLNSTSTGDEAFVIWTPCSALTKLSKWSTWASKHTSMQNRRKCLWTCKARNPWMMGVCLLAYFYPWTIIRSSRML